jgi:carbamoyltransferase
MFLTGQKKYSKPKQYLEQFGIKNIPIIESKHHEAHAAMGYYTSDYDDALIIVADGIGELECLTVWTAKNNTMKKIKTYWYPNSIGLLYSAFTQKLGLKPNEEEYIMMGMAAFGKPYYYYIIEQDFLENNKLKINPHRGIKEYLTLDDLNKFDIAASVQQVLENYIFSIIDQYKSNSTNLVLSGGVFMNCVLNQKISNSNIFNAIHIAPNPTDAGLSIGAVLSHTKKRIKMDSLYLGYDIEKDINYDEVVNYLIKNKICGFAAGKAEFGQRALGNRSLLADPRGDDVKDRVNNIKKRELFRPFAPVILEEEAHKYFKINDNQNCIFMQYTPVCLKPKEFPAIVHIDGTSRVQTVPKNDSHIRKILELFFEKTGCPMLLNTSLNIKGEPIVNTRDDANLFEKLHNVRVF